MPKAVLMMGLPGAGKSYTVARRIPLDQFTVIDPDAIKAEQPDYDPQHPEVYHEWSKQQADMRRQAAMAAGHNVVVDGTGTSAEKMAHLTKELQAAGYTVEVLYVRVRLETALARNAKRERHVPESIIHEKYEILSTSFEIVSLYADTVTVVDND